MARVMSLKVLFRQLSTPFKPSSDSALCPVINKSAGVQIYTHIRHCTYLRRIRELLQSTGTWELHGRRVSATVHSTAPRDFEEPPLRHMPSETDLLGCLDAFRQPCAHLLPRTQCFPELRGRFKCSLWRCRPTGLASLPYYSLAQ